MSGEFIPYEGWGLVVLAIIGIICIVAFLVSMKYSEKINDFFVDFINKLFKRNTNENKKRKEK
jgi:hypothetical protein